MPSGRWLRSDYVVYYVATINSMTEESAEQASTPTIETADAVTGDERAVRPSVRAPFVAREHQAPPTGEPPYQRQPGDVIQANGTREPLREVDSE